MMLSAQLQNEQNEKSLILQKQQQEFTAFRAEISALESELERHRAQCQDESFILNKHQEELVSIRARIPVMDEEVILIHTDRS